VRALRAEPALIILIRTTWRDRGLADEVIVMPRAEWWSAARRSGCFLRQHPYTVASGSIPRLDRETERLSVEGMVPDATSLSGCRFHPDARSPSSNAFHKNQNLKRKNPAFPVACWRRRCDSFLWSGGW
jgi:hypothetical protein